MQVEGARVDLPVFCSSESDESNESDDDGHAAGVEAARDNDKDNDNDDISSSDNNADHQHHQPAMADEAVAGVAARLASPSLLPLSPDPSRVNLDLSALLILVSDVCNMTEAAIEAEKAHRDANGWVRRPSSDFFLIVCAYGKLTNNQSPRRLYLFIFIFFIFADSVAFSRGGGIFQHRGFVRAHGHAADAGGVSRR